MNLRDLQYLVALLGDRRSFPNPHVLEALRDVILDRLPNTVRKACGTGAGDLRPPGAPAAVPAGT